MTYEEFKQRAENPTHRDVPSYFQVKVIEIERRRNKYGSKHYPKYGIDCYTSGVTLSQEEALEMMRKDVAWRKEEGYSKEVYCYFITERPLNGLAYEREYLAEWTYDVNGQLIDRTYCSSGFVYGPNYEPYRAEESHPDEIFRGRPEEHIRFHKGDIVEVFCRNEVRLAIVVGTPLTTKFVWDKNQNTKDKRGLDEIPYDETDDSYTVIDGPGYEYHNHIQSRFLFAPHFRLSADMEKRFKGYLEKAELYEAAHDCSFKNKEQIEQSKICGCFSCCRIFPASEVTSYLPDAKPTAICPYCHIDSVIGDASGFPITPLFLREMRRKWF